MDHKEFKRMIRTSYSQNFNLITSIKSFDFLTLYTTIPYQKLKSRLATIIRNFLFIKMEIADFGFRLRRTLFCKEHSDSKRSTLHEDDIINMLDFSS